MRSGSYIKRKGTIQRVRIFLPLLWRTVKIFRTSVYSGLFLSGSSITNDHQIKCVSGLSEASSKRFFL